jgi:hypothetical protein
MAGMAFGRLDHGSTHLLFPHHRHLNLFQAEGLFHDGGATVARWMKLVSARKLELKGVPRKKYL